MRKKSHFEFFSFHVPKSLFRTRCPFRDIQTILHDWFSDYFCATICFLYNYCWKPVFEICIIGKICRKNYMSIACFFASVPVTSLNQHKKQLKTSSDTTKENCPSQKASSRDGDMLKYIVSPTTPTFFLF